MSGKTPISERVNEVIPANTAALAMSLQIPTFYKYMAYYDQGILKPIPPLVMGFLKLVDNGTDADGAREYLSSHLERRTEVASQAQEAPATKTDEVEELMKRIEGTRSGVKMQEEAIEANYARLDELRANIPSLEAERDADPDNMDKRMRLDVERRNIDSVESQIEKLCEMRGRMMSDLDSLVEEYETITGGEVAKRWTKGDVRTLCVGDSARSMIVFDEPMGKPDSVKVLITIETPYGTLPVATIAPAEGCDYITIGDMVPAARLSYEVVETYSDKELRSGKFKLMFE